MNAFGFDACLLVGYYEQPDTEHVAYSWVLAQHPEAERARAMAEQIAEHLEQGEG